MLLIDCPWCGPRDETEFHYGGQAHVAYPADPHGAQPTRSGPTTCSSACQPEGGDSPSAGAIPAGCRRWFNAVRDTVTHEFSPSTGSASHVR